MVTDMTLFEALRLLVISSVALAFWFKFLLRIRVETAALMSFAIGVAVLTMALWLSARHDYQWYQQESPLHDLIEHRLQSRDGPVFLVALLVLANLTVALLMKLYRVSVLDKATLEERTPGVAGIRAWLSPINVATIIAITVFANLSLNYDYAGVAIAGLCILLAYPLINTMMQHSLSPAASADSPSPLKAPAEERQRVLALVEAGKITAEDGAELLTALAQSQAASGSGAGTISGPRRIMLVGAGIALVGFFLPWFTLNVTQAMRDAMASIQQNPPQFGDGAPPTLNFTPPPGVDGSTIQSPVQNAMHIIIRGGDVQHGLGWIILAAGLFGSCLPFFWTPPAGKTRHMRNAVLTALGVGSVLIFYVLSGSFNSATSIEPGFVLAIAGYVVLWVGSIREYVALPARLHPTLAGI